jgi:hypothetical protein
MSSGRIALAFVLSAAWCTAVFAQDVVVGQPTVVFDNFGPSNTHSNGGTWMGSGFNEVMFSAEAFTPTASGQVTQFDAQMWTFPGNLNQVTLYVMTQAGTVPPTSSSIWSQSYQGALRTDFNAPPATFQVTNGPHVDAGTRYWLYVEVPATGTYSPQYDWEDGLTGSNSTAWYFAQSPTRAQTWTIFDPPVDPGRALRVTAIVPEPTACLAPVLAGCLLLRYSGRRKRETA